MTTTYPTQKTFFGTVTQILGNRILFKTNTGVVYDAETSNTTFERKNGAPMEYKEILVGDKVQVTGKLWQDNSMQISRLRNKSLYLHSSTVTGKVTSTDTHAQAFTLQGPGGKHIVQTDKFTTFKKNSELASINSVLLGTTAKVKGVWERLPQIIQARHVEIKARLVKIEVTGQLVGSNGNFLTVTAHNVIYAVDAGAATFTTKSRKPISIHELIVGGTVKIVGKHLPENVNITASGIKKL